MKFTDIIRATVASVKANKNYLIDTLTIPFILEILMSVIASADINPVMNGMSNFISLLLHVTIAIATHRIILLGPEASDKWSIYSWSLREVLFLIHIILISFLPVIALMSIFNLFSAIPLIAITLLGILFIISRLSLVFPGIAINKSVSIFLSWRLTSKHKLLIFLVVIILPIMLVTPPALLLSVLQLDFLSPILLPFITVFQVSALSLTYKYIMEEAYGR